MTRIGFVRALVLRKPSWPNSLVVVSCAVAVASFLRWLFGHAADPVPFVTYFPAILISTVLAGWRAGLVSVLASMMVVDVFFIGERAAVTADWQTAMMMAIFVLSCLFLVAIAQTLRVTFAQLQAANDRTEFLNRELIHRVRNSLTIVNSLAALTFQTDPANFSAMFSKRMAALSGGLDLLARHGGEHCDLREMVEKACLPFRQDDRLTVTGPSCSLPSDVCMPLVLAIHELCTNAVKYGAFSATGGRVKVETAVEAGEAVIVWQEAGGPPVSPPTKQGLGSALLAHPALGPAEVSFLPHGLRCQMRIKLAL